MQAKIEKQRAKVVRLKQKEAQEQERLEALQSQISEAEEELRMLELTDIEAIMKEYRMGHDDVILFLKSLKERGDRGTEDVIHVQEFEDLM